MTNAVLCALIGLPGAGKTTLAKLLKSECQKFPPLQVIHISFDEIFSNEEQKVVVSDIIKTSKCKLFKDLRENFYNIVKQVLMLNENRSFQCPKFPFLQGIDFSEESNKYVIVLDDNFYYRSMRYKYHQLACQYSTGYCQIYIDCERSIAEQNNKHRLVQVPNSVIATMNDRMEAPANNCWEKQSMFISSTNMSNFLLDIPKILQLLNYNLENCLSTPEQKSDKAEHLQQQCLQSLSHQADLLLRGFVAEEMNYVKAMNSNKSYLKMMSSSLNKIRQTILGKIRNRFVDFNLFTCNENINEDKLKSIFKSEYNLMLVNNGLQ